MSENPESNVPESADIESTDIRIKKVKKNSKGVVTIHYQKPNGDEFDDFTMSCKSYPHPDLLQAFKDLVPHVIEICELPASYQEDLEVSGVSFSYKDDNMGAVITAQKKLATNPGPFILNTPHKPVSPYSEDGDESVCLSTTCAMMLDRLQKEATLYIQGKRGSEPEASSVDIVDDAVEQEN